MARTPLVATKVLLTLSALAVLVGCGGLRARHDGAVDGRAVERLERIGRRDMQCREALRIAQITNVDFQIDGCGQLREYAYTCVGRRRCDWQPVVPALGRATVDMQCPIEQLSMATPTSTQRDFLGCGRAASYQLVCMAAGCTWVSMPPPTQTVSAPPPTITVTVGDPSLETAVIPPPPGSGPRPQDVTPPPADPSTVSVPPPPTRSTEPTVPPPPP